MEGNGKAFVDVEISEIGETGGETVEEEVGGADSEGCSGSALEAEPAAANEGASVAGGLGVEAGEDFND